MGREFVILEINELIYKEVNFVRSRVQIWSYTSLSSFQNASSRPDTDLTEARMTLAAPRRMSLGPSHMCAAGCRLPRLLGVSVFFIHKNCMSERIALGRLGAQRETVSATHFILSNFPRKFPMFLSMRN